MGVGEEEEAVISNMVVSGRWHRNVGRCWQSMEWGEVGSDRRVIRKVSVGDQVSRQ